jgi:Fe-S-cluster containining protein
MVLPVVDRQEFEAISCNRCGACCEDFHLNTPGEGELYWKYAGPLGWLELYCYRLAHGERPDDAEFWTIKGGAGDPMLWYGQLIPRYDEGREAWFYSCQYVTRGEGGLGCCTIWDRRPDICSKFPYGKPLPPEDRERWPKCSWIVELLDFEVVEA